MGSRTEEPEQDLVEEQGSDLDWWHRDHPVFAPLTGFFAGVLGITVLPALVAASLRATLGYEQAERWIWLGALVLLVPLGMLLNSHSRRAGAYVLLGMVLTVLVVGGVGSVVLWFLMR